MCSKLIIARADVHAVDKVGILIYFYFNPNSHFFHVVLLLLLHQAFLKRDWFLSFVDVTIIFQEKKTALHVSAINGHKDVCSLLVEAHAEVNALDNVLSRRF